jgi:pilus assembly protein FimV
MSLALGLTLLPISVFAAGLGQLSVASGIGEPLRAEIELLSVTPAEIASLTAKIAPEATYAAQGIERPASHRDINVQITKSASGKDILKLRSDQPMTEPFLDMLVEVEWETGRVLREYTVLLDPPGYNNAIATPQIQKPAVKSVNNLAEKSPAPITQTKPASSTTSTATPVATKNTEADDYLTRKGDTLSTIARRLKPEGISLDQMLVGLFEANPEAFSGNNMNRLKVGKILQTPSEEALNAIDRKEAIQEIRLQTVNWNEYRNKLAGVVADSTPLTSEEESQSASGKIKPATEDKSISESAGPKDVVKLSSGDAKITADLETKITALQEEVSAREKGLIEAQDRTAALEKQIEDMQKLLTLKSDALSEAQKAGQEAAIAEQQLSVDETNAVEVPPVRFGTKLTEEDAVKAPAIESKPAATVVEKAKPVELPPVESPSFISSLLDSFKGLFGNLDTTLLGVGAGLIALLTGGWFYLRNKRRKSLADFEQGIMTSGGLKANTVFGNTSGASVDTGDTSFLTDFSQSTSGGMIDTNDVDPIAEAEVYMAYGRDAQAEEILKDAITKEPKRYELHLKLLEMYAANKDMSAFETVSGELYTTLGAEDPTWAKVAEIGIKLEPNNPLYQTKAGVAVSKNIESNADEKLYASDFSDSPLAAEADLDFSLNDDFQSEVNPSEQQNQVEEASNNGIDFNIDETTLNIPNVSEMLDTEDSALEFDLNISNEKSSDEILSDVTINEGNFAHTMPNLDFPKLEVEEELAQDVESNEMVSDSDKLPEFEMPNDLSLDIAESSSSDNADSEISLTDSVAEEVKEENFGFDIDTITDDTITFNNDVNSDDTNKDHGVVDSEQANILDFSDISLEVNDDVNQAISDATPAVVSEPISTEPESEEVETKLELVAAYIDMEDKEGAKELLEEVLKEGGVNQRKRAEEILASIA